jgi:hypothetical protein
VIRYLKFHTNPVWIVEEDGCAFALYRSTGDIYPCLAQRPDDIIYRGAFHHQAEMVDPLRPASVGGIRAGEYVDFLGTDFEDPPNCPAGATFSQLSLPKSVVSLGRSGGSSIPGGSSGRGIGIGRGGSP